MRSTSIWLIGLPLRSMTVPWIAAKTVKTVCGTFVIVRRRIQRFIPTMYHKYVERNDGHVNHMQSIFVAALYRWRNSPLKETHRRNPTSTSEDQTPQNWTNSSDKRWHPERRRVRPYSIHQWNSPRLARTAEYRSKGSLRKDRRQPALHIECSGDRGCRNLFECQST